MDYLQVRSPQFLSMAAFGALWVQRKRKSYISYPSVLSQMYPPAQTVSLRTKTVQSRIPYPPPRNQRLMRILVVPLLAIVYDSPRISTIYSQGNHPRLFVFPPQPYPSPSPPSTASSPSNALLLPAFLVLIVTSALPSPVTLMPATTLPALGWTCG